MIFILKSFCSKTVQIYLWMNYLFWFTQNVIKVSCTFNYYYNNTSIKPTVLAGGDALTLANQLNKKSLKCTINNDIPITLPNYPYVVVNRSIPYNCELEEEEGFLLDSLAACSDNPDQFKMNVSCQ